MTNPPPPKLYICLLNLEGQHIGVPKRQLLSPRQSDLCLSLKCQTVSLAACGPAVVKCPDKYIT